MADDEYSELIDEHLQQRGVVCMTAKNGDKVMIFTTEILERLLARSIKGGGKVVVLVRAGPQA
jgi:hypothetical protein